LGLTDDPESLSDERNRRRILVTRPKLIRDALSNGNEKVLAKGHALDVLHALGAKSRPTQAVIVRKSFVEIGTIAAFLAV
jgi:hypothetical protein